MRLFTLLFLCTFLTFEIAAQTTVFSDDFDSGTSQWTATGSWGASSSYYYNGSNSLADSPFGAYTNNVNSTVTQASNMDFSTSLDAFCGFKVIYDIENGFDTCYMDISTNGGTSWTNIYHFNGENTLSSMSWQDVNIPLGGFVGSSQVKLRFRMFTDGGYTSDGIYIDSFRVVTSTVDNSPPFLIHNAMPHYEGELDTNFRTATIQDASGVALATLSYVVDGAAMVNTITAYDTTGNNYHFAIPPQTPGAFVDYWFTAIDSSPQTNSLITDTFHYVAGNYIRHENGVVDYIQNFGPASGTGNTGIANRMTLQGNTTLTTAIVRTYTDVNNPQDSITIHVWSNNGGNPGTDLITPITVWPASSISYPNLVTVLDLRPYASALDSLQGDIFIGYTVPSGNTWTTYTNVSNGRGRYYNGTSWSTATSTASYHFRVVTGPSEVGPTADFTYDNANDPSVDFFDASSANTTSLLWDFNGEATSTAANPTHTFNTPGFKTVCLTASNFVGSDQHCENILILNSKPKADFSYSVAQDPTIQFSDESLYNPTSWLWEFGDGTFSNDTNPVHTYYSVDTFNTCLYVTNQYGSDTFCDGVIVKNAVPISNFGHTILGGNKVFFNDMSTNSPNAWKWYFGSLDSTTVQNPNYTFPTLGGDYVVCLTASNQYGDGLPFCDTLDIPDITGVEELAQLGLSIGPNPATDVISIQSETSLSDKRISLYSVDGKLIDIQLNQTDNFAELNVSQLSSGMYILRIYGDDQFHVSTPVLVRK